MPIPTTIPRKLPGTGRRELRLVMKANKPQVAVYGGDGTLLGVCDPDAIQELANPPGQPDKKAQADVDAQAAQVQANTPQGAAAAEVAKSVGPVLGTLKPRPAGEVRKAATSLSDQWAHLVKSAGPAGAALQSGVAQAALALMVSGRAEGTRAVTLCKRAACQIAVDRRLI